MDGRMYTERVTVTSARNQQLEEAKVRLAKHQPLLKLPK
jgi:hypothetical protein